ncbi:MAG: homogentisate 1,2-dioxygenase, partial [Deltaproteobacteria bacterium]
SYHLGRPHAVQSAELAHGSMPPEAAPWRPLAKRHYMGQTMQRRGGPMVDARVPLLFNQDVVLSMAHPDSSCPVYFANGDGDDLYFIVAGEGILRSPYGDLPFAAHDYLCVPKGVMHRFVLPPSATPTTIFCIECLGGLSLLKQFRNSCGQLSMDAPYCHRDFRKPTFLGPQDEAIRHLVVKRQHRTSGYVYAASPLDVVGYDGSVYPWAFPIRNFQPRVGQVHLPPTWHGTFAARGALICSFVPRPTDFHPDAIACPYPHASVDCDEVLLYLTGNFTSRRGVGEGSISHHPAGVPHGPHPGAYERSVGKVRTDELAVMLDTSAPLQATAAALQVEDMGYQQSFI